MKMDQSSYCLFRHTGAADFDNKSLNHCRPKGLWWTYKYWVQIHRSVWPSAQPGGQKQGGVSVIFKGWAAGSAMKETNGMDLAAPGHMWMWMSRQADTYCIGDILLRSRTWISTYILCPSFQQASSRSSSWHGHWTHFYTGACFEVRFLMCFEACLKKITIHLWIRKGSKANKNIWTAHVNVRRTVCWHRGETIYCSFRQRR